MKVEPMSSNNQAVPTPDFDFAFPMLEKWLRSLMAKRGASPSEEDLVELQQQADEIKRTYEAKIAHMGKTYQVELAKAKEERNAAVETAIERTREEARENMPHPLVLAAAEKIVGRIAAKCKPASDRVRGLFSVPGKLAAFEAEKKAADPAHAAEMERQKTE